MATFSWSTCSAKMFCAGKPIVTRITLNYFSPTLWNSRVLHSRLDDLDRVILEVEVDLALADAVLFLAWFKDCFLEVGVEAEHLLIKSHPGREVGACTSRDGAVRGLWQLEGKALTADARLLEAHQLVDLIADIKVVRFVELGLSQLHIKKSCSYTLA